MTEPNEQAAEQNQEQASSAIEARSMSPDDLLKTTVDKESVVSFIEGMMQAMGSSMAGQLPQAQPRNQVRLQQEANDRKYQSKAVNIIMKKLERVEKYPDTAREVQNDHEIHDWLNRNGCKQKDYYEELECAQELTSFYGGYRQFEMAIKAATKALNITQLHRRDDEETLVELNWVLAELHAASDNMTLAMDYMRKCLNLVEPGAGEDHPTYNELLAQLKETNNRSRMVTAG